MTRRPCSALARVALSLCLLATASVSPAQGQAQGDVLPSPILSKSKLDSLRKLLTKWYALDLQSNDMLRTALAEKQSRKRDSLRRKAAKQREKARAAKRKFNKAFLAEGEKAGTILRSVPDLLSIFRDCFPYAKQSNGGRVREDKLSKGSKETYAFRFPQKYEPTKRSYPLVYVLPPKVGKGWGKKKELIDQLWPKDTAPKAHEEFVVLMPRFEDDAPLNEEVEPSEIPTEARQLKVHFLRNLGNIFKRFRVDTDRVYLQACGDSIPFALRMASLYSDRFAGLILVDPKQSEFDGTTVFSNLTGLGVAIAASGDDKKHADGIAKAMEEAGVKNIKRIDASGMAGFGSKSGELYTWLEGVKRQLYRRSFTHTPATDRGWQAYWCQILTAEYLADVKLSERPMVKVSADREKNRIEIEGRNVSKVLLYLNDILVDLEKDITLVLNGQVKTVRAQRSLRLLADPREGLVVKRGDSRYVFTATDTYTLPNKEDGKAKGDGGEER